MRASRRESPGFWARCARFNRFNNARPSASPFFVTNFAVSAGNKSAMGVFAVALMMVPECVTGKKPDEKLPLPLKGNPCGSGSTTNVGRLLFKLPKPYEIHEPRHGNPGVRKPDVCK